MRYGVIKRHRGPAVSSVACHPGIGIAHHQHRPPGPLEHFLRRAAQEQPAERPAPVRAETWNIVTFGLTARALAMAPQVMFFDEATSALDPEMVKGILQLIADLGADGMTMIVVTHEMGFARSASDCVVFMDQGKVVESGPPDQIFDDAQTERLQRFLSQVL